MKPAIFSAIKSIELFIGSVMLLSLLAACGGGGGGSAPAAPAGTTPTLSNGEGTVSSPINVALDTPRSSTVGTLTNSYYSFTTTNAGSYLVSITNPSASVIWYLYSDAGYSTAVGSSCAAACINNLAANTKYYLRVKDWGSSAATFTLAVKLIKSEGTTAAPITLNVGTASYAGSVGMAGVSYYRFLTGAAPSAYTVTLKRRADISGYYPLGKIGIFASPFDATPQVALTGGGDCDMSVTTCSFNALAANTYYYVRIDGDANSGSLYDIVVDKGVSEGAKDNRISLVVGGSALNGAVDAYGVSYYQYTTTLAGEYILTIGSTTPSVYANPTSATSACYPGQECRQIYLEAGVTYQIDVRNPNNISAANYQIAIAKGVTEGTWSNPLPLTVGVAHNAAIDVSAGGSAYYKFTTTSFGGSYTIGLTGTQKDLRWNLATDASYAYPVYGVSSCDVITTAGAGDEVCASGNLEPNKTYYLTVANKESTGPSPYSLKVDAGGGSEGTMYTPLQISGSTHDGSVSAGGYSYYSFTTGANALTYVIGLSNMQTDLRWALYTPGNNNALVDCSSNTGTLPEICSTQSISGAAAQVLTANTTYNLIVANGNSSTMSTFRLTLTPLDPAAGCSGSVGSTCFGFEDGLLPAGFTNTTTNATGSWQWSVDSTNGASGSKSLKSGTLKWGADACIEYKPAVKPASVSFSLKSDTINNFSLTVYDGTTQIASLGYWAGAIPWRRVTMPTATLSGASYTFKWCLNYNNTSGVTGTTVWIDDIEFQ